MRMQKVRDERFLCYLYPFLPKFERISIHGLEAWSIRLRVC